MLRAINRSTSHIHQHIPHIPKPHSLRPFSSRKIDVPPPAAFRKVAQDGARKLCAENCQAVSNAGQEALKNYELGKEARSYFPCVYSGCECFENLKEKIADTWQNVKFVEDDANKCYNSVEFEWSSETARFKYCEKGPQRSGNPCLTHLYKGLYGDEAILGPANRILKSNFSSPI